MEQNLVEEGKKSSRFDLKRFFIKVLRNYYWLLACTALFVGAAYLYLRYTVPVYQVTAYLQIQMAPDAAKIMGGSAFSSGSAAGRETYPDMNGEIVKLYAEPLLGEVIDSLKLTIEVTKNGKIKNKPLDIETLPVSIEILDTVQNANSDYYVLRLDDTTFNITNGVKSETFGYGQPVMIDRTLARITMLNPQEAKMNGEYRVRFLSKPDVIAGYKQRMTVGTVPKGGFNMLQVAVRDEIPARARRFIEVLKFRYDFSNYMFRNRSLESEIRFLDQRVAAVDAELEQQENYVKNFKAGNKITDVTSSANQLLGNIASIGTKKSDNLYKESLLNMVESNLRATDGREERINVTGLQDGDLAVLVAKYNDLVSQKANLLAEAAPRDLRIPPLNAKLNETKESIRNRVTSLKQELHANNQFLDNQEKSASGMFSTMPAKEKDFIQVNRLLNIKQALYIFLLQRKEDKTIEAASSAMTDSRAVDWKISNVQEPQPMVLYAMAFGAGIVIPSLVIFLRTLLNKKIETSKEITQATSLPVVGEIAFAGKSSNELLVLKDNVSPVAEHFRTLRTNLFFLSHGLANKVLLVTSGSSGEGKSFVSLNLANTIAMSGKKTVLLEFDLRNPGILSSEDSEPRPGIINYLTGDVRLEDIIHDVQGCDNLSFIDSGTPLSLNTGEIILSPKMLTLFQYLKSRFEFIILDTPPVEAVSDALILSEWADFSLFVIRHRYTTRASLELINKLHEDSKTPNPLLVINSIQSGSDFNNHQGYGYGYGYGKAGKYNRKKSGSRHNLKIA